MSSTAETDVCRVGVQFESGRVDFVLPAELSVAAVIPSIVEHAVARAGAPGRHDWQEVPAGWELSRIDGRALSSRKSLRDNAVHDGDLLRLSRARPGVASPPADDPIARLSSALDALPRWTPAATRVAILVGSLLGTALVAYALLRSTSSAPPVLAGLMSAVALVAAVAVQREPLTAVGLGCSAAASSAVAAYVMVPGSAMAPKLMLAAVAGSTVSVVAARCVGSGAAVFTGLSSAGLLSAAAACVHVVAPVGVAATGAVLAGAAVVLLVLAARVAIWAGRVPVPRLLMPGIGEDATPVEQCADRAHAITTGLVCGSSAAAALGTSLVAHGGGGYGGAAFAAAIAMTLMLRTGTHVDLVQVAALFVGGTMCLASVFVWAVETWRQHAHWIALAAAGIAAGVAACSSTSMTASPLTRRCVDLTEYAALASLIPLACWVCGAFTAVRGLHLS